ncbi:MAG: hypothetical protein HN584_14155 [Akkermansiaceae bacterium]|jgi:hypothetical protein|nr:hypothetical protein [Akkermansiaceae bacterium]MDG1853925.1 hypothetical protein [Verrucomicrobiales bacterium]
MKERIQALISFLRPNLFVPLVFFIGTSNCELRAADEDLKISESLASDVEELNVIVYRYQLAGGWFSESDNAKLVLTRLAMAHGDFGLPRLVHPREGRFIAVTAQTPPQNQKWVYWNNSTRRFQLWRGVAPHDVQIVTRFLRDKEKILTAKVDKISLKKKAAKAN